MAVTKKIELDSATKNSGIKFVKLNNFLFQKARLARIQIAKATSGAAFVAKKRAAEARLAAQVTHTYAF